jgi:hypothetical protein
MKDFRTLKVWEKAHAVTLAVYKATETFPKHELYGVTSQIQPPQFPSQPTSPKVVARTATQNSNDISSLQWGQPANWNIFSCLPVI